MKLQFTTLLLLVSSATAYVNRTLTNGFGSTPAQRHYISAAQAQKVIEAAVAYSYKIGYAEYANLHQSSLRLTSTGYPTT